MLCRQRAFQISPRVTTTAVWQTPSLRHAFEGNTLRAAVKMVSCILYLLVSFDVRFPARS